MWMNLTCCMEGKAVMTAEGDANIDWDLTTWKGSRLQQHREFLALPFRRKLETIEQLEDLGRAFQRRHKRKDLSYVSMEIGQPVPGAVVREQPPESEADCGNK